MGTGSVFVSTPGGGSPSRITPMKLLRPVYAYSADDKELAQVEGALSIWPELGRSGVDATQGIAGAQPKMDRMFNVPKIDFSETTGKYMNVAMERSLFNKDFSIATKIKFNFINRYNTIFSIGDAVNYKGIQLTTAVNGTLALYSYGVAVTHGAILTTTKEYFLSCAFKTNGSVTLYVDDVAQEGTLGAMNVGTTQGGRIGASSLWADAYSTSAIRWIAFYDRFLNEDENRRLALL